jgi:hypothetical protein
MPLNSTQARIIFYNPWADAQENSADYLGRLPRFDLATRLPPDADERLRRMARLDCDWYGECVRCFDALQHSEFVFQPSWLVGNSGLADFAGQCAQKPAGEVWWFVFMGQHPEKIGPALAPLCAHLRHHGVRIAYYAFDEASRTMPCFSALAPHLDILIHDEFPLAPAAARLRPDCLTRHRSWVANVVPFAVPFNENPEPKIIFLGSQLGLTPHRHRQIDFLRSTFKDLFIAHHDHSLSVAERAGLSRYAVGFCPEGRKFTTPAMAGTHTDRPFWSGCLGLVPVSENSVEGGRLDELADAGLIRRYAHSDLPALRAACEQALATPVVERRRIYEHFNRQETVGPVLAEALAAAHIKTV